MLSWFQVHVKPIWVKFMLMFAKEMLEFFAKITIGNEIVTKLIQKRAQCCTVIVN